MEKCLDLLDIADSHETLLGFDGYLDSDTCQPSQ